MQIVIKETTNGFYVTVRDSAIDNLAKRFPATLDETTLDTILGMQDEFNDACRNDMATYLAMVRPFFVTILDKMNEVCTNIDDVKSIMLGIAAVSVNCRKAAPDYCQHLGAFLQHAMDTYLAKTGDKTTPVDYCSRTEDDNDTAE